MKKTNIAAGITLALSATVANAAFMTPGSTGVMEFTGGCFTFGDCTIGGTGNIIDNDIQVLEDNTATAASGLYGTGVAGDGLVGKIEFTVGGDGNTMTITSFQQDTYTGTAGGDFAIDYTSLAAMTLSISDTGDITWGTEGRVGLADSYSFNIGLAAWNINDSTNIGTGATGAYETFTTGSDVSYNPGADAVVGFTVNGAALASTGANTWDGTIVSAGNVGTPWGFFDGNPYSEKFNVTLTEVSAVPVPAAVWLFGSGLLGLVGVARRKKA